MDARKTPPTPESSAAPGPGERALLEEIDALRRANAELRAEAAAQAALRDALTGQEEILEAFFRHTQTCLVLLDRQFNFIRVNDAYAHACARDASEFPGRNHFELYPSPLIEDFRRVVTEKKPWSIAARPFVFPDHPEWGTTYWDLAVVPILDRHGEVGHLVFSLHDVTPILRAEESLRESEARYRKAQKMESIGRLAGGVAHDFNNLLMIINGLTSVAIDSLGRSHSVTEDLRAVLDAGRRAAALTRQLLAFSRQQVLQPVVVSCNDIIGGMESMLRRLIGEDIELRFLPATDLRDVLVDPSQMEQVVMNLAVNARDAMPGGGLLLLATRNLPRGSEEARQHGLGDRDCVLLSVTDTGSGMDEATRARAFEPFFTTKGVGKGTGLGLATVYGIVRQSGGDVTVRSEPGKGTTFEVCLPAVAPGARDARPTPPAPTSARGHEAVLVVEDEDAVRALVERVLRAAGYEVLAAESGERALALCEARKEPLHLVLTDVIMPRMSGPELVNRLTHERPSLKALYMSGHPEDAFAQHTDLRFIAKPLSPEALTQKVREALDEE